ncbi:hypothetical protein ALC53_05755, partial [Atta colombica]
QSVYEPNSRHLREILIFCFNMKKSAAEAHRMLSKNLCEAAISGRTSDNFQISEIILKQIPNFELVSSLVIDYMHLICFGVVKKLISFFLLYTDPIVLKEILRKMLIEYFFKYFKKIWSDNFSAFRFENYMSNIKILFENGTVIFVLNLIKHSDNTKIIIGKNLKAKFVY